VQYKLGKKPPVVDSRTLQVSKYLDTLSAPPASVNYYNKVSNWPMYDNDRFGDCTCAAAGHMEECWPMYATGVLNEVPNLAVMHMYRHFNPYPQDNGCTLIEVLKYWRRVGLHNFKIDGFAQVQVTNTTEVKQAIDLFGGLYIGLALTNFVVPDTGANWLDIPWNLPAPSGTSAQDAAPNPNNGHCVNIVGYDDNGLTFITWGALKTMNWEFFNAVSDEAYAVLSPNWFNASGVSPVGLNLTALQQDLKQV